MRINRKLVSLVLVGLVGVSLGIATASMSDSGTLAYTITAAAPTDEGELVWICKLAGPPAEPKLAPGKNPLQVSVDSTDAQNAFSDAHPSYVVASGDVVCVEPDDETVTTSDTTSADTTQPPDG